MKSARRAAEVEAKRKASVSVGGGADGAGGMEPPVGYLFGGLLLGFLGGGLSMRAWDALAVGRALVGTEWAASASLPMRVTLALPAWVWTLLLFASASAVMFASARGPSRRAPDSLMSTTKTRMARPSSASWRMASILTGARGESRCGVACSVTRRC